MRFAALLAAACLTWAGCSPTTPAAGPQDLSTSERTVGDVLTFTPSADARVEEDRPRDNFGTDGELLMDNSPRMQSLLRFEVSGVHARVSAAKLRAWVTNAATNGPSVQLTSNDWSETEVTWENRPAPRGPALDDRGVVLSGRWVEYDVTAGVTGNGPVSFVLISASSDAMGVMSREHITSPQLVVTVEPSTDPQPRFPIRAAVYRADYPEAWAGTPSPFTRYQPQLGTYESSAAETLDRHLEAMQYGNIKAGLMLWGGRGHVTDQRLGLALARSAGTPFRWAAYHEAEGHSDPSVDELAADLTHLKNTFGGDPSYLRVNGQFVVFVYSDAGDGCAMVSRWKQANRAGAYLVLRSFPGAEACAEQPDAWHPNTPETALTRARGSVSVSPGAWNAASAAPALPRELARWNADVREMVSSGADWQLITTFNDWAAGSAVEAAVEWPTASGHGGYLEALHNDGDDSCRPTTCGAARKNCGALPDGCGATLDCGDCNAGQTCDDNVCTPPSLDPVLAVGGDIAGPWGADELTAQVIDRLNPTGVLLLGDNVYPTGTRSQYADFYAPTWGRHREKTFPSPGNHDHGSSNLDGYCNYFGAAAHCRNGYGYYSFNLGGWHIISLDSGCSAPSSCANPMAPGSSMRQWLLADLAANTQKCTLAYWHHPRFSSGSHGPDDRSLDVWRDLYAAGVDVVFGGHDHHYERFAPQTPDGQLDLARGIRSFVVGTGGAAGRALGGGLPHSEARDDTSYGVLKFTLHAESYEWEFLPVEGARFTDKGSADCH